jgi:hypothetical protein
VTAPASLVRSVLAPRPAAPELPVPGAGWIFLCLGVQIACQLSLIVPALSPTRVLARSVAIGMSLVLLFIVPGRPFVRHPVRMWIGGIAMILGFSALNPDGAGALAVAAHIGFYVSVFAPIFWVARLNCNAKALGHVLVAFWVFSTASAVVGVLQAYYPGRFLPSAGIWAEYGPKNMAKMMITLSSGASIPRPPGLTDVPGGAVNGSFFAVLLGIGVALLRPFPFARLAAALSAIAGMTCIYLCQFRSALIVLGVCVLAVVGLLALAGRGSRSVVVAAATLAFVTIGFVIALDLGGQAVSNRFATLSTPGSLYYTSRGGMVEAAFTELLPEFPLGAGLGRWGMIAHYFGGGGRSLWAEVQWAAWVIDGGFPMLVAYPVAALIVVVHSIRLALRRTESHLEVWATVIAGYNVGGIALTFSYAIFMSTSGVEFWLINAALIQAAAIHAARNAQDPVTIPPPPRVPSIAPGPLG